MVSLSSDLRKAQAFRLNMFHAEDTSDFDSTTYSRIQVQEYKKRYKNVYVKIHGHLY